MIPGLEMLACQDLAVPTEIMEHVVRVESSFNPYAIGVVGARLARQPRSLDEAVATASRLELDGYNFSLGLAQVNRHNLAAQGLSSYEDAFAACPNLAAGARILADCHVRAGGDWDKAFSCYYSGNFVRGFRDGYVQKIRSSMVAAGLDLVGELMAAIPLASGAPRRATPKGVAADLRERRAAGPVSVPARPDPPGSSWNLPLVGQNQGEDGPGAAFPASGLDGAPFVPQVTGPGTAQALPSSPSPSPGRAGDSAFVF
ncbi:lytic transglycosylase domain-containing protein [Luteimonas terricola]|uniref:Transglycosylase SLT domain-containing protein n=1 Tax=Luteimonas terricola TaxID=645597 RepID=A0ABQ2E925_9GAMM|nr:lytic transglycosylase domain-containing protein [Luteimonas terricola]GGK01365.1 hypothetical protein GCM10011394_08260 [Luteimonas terricola]